MSIEQSNLGFKDEFDSKEEMWFFYYLSELKAHGWLKDFVYQPVSFVLSEDVFVPVMNEGKNINKLSKVKLTRGASYTADFKLIWDRKSKGVFCWSDMGVYPKGHFPYRKARANSFIPFYASTHNQDLISYVDVKGTNVQAYGLAKFSIVQKWLYKKGVFVQKIVVSLDEKSIFAKTFFPRTVVSTEVYKRNCKFGKEGDSKIKCDIKLIESWTKLLK